MMRTIVLLLMVLPSLVIASPWPALDHPPGARVEGIGELVRLNGVPMRLTRVLAVEPVDRIVAHYRKALGVQSAHAHAGSTQVLSQGRGDFFITITINPLDGGFVEALVSVADVPGAREAADRPLGFVLPAGSELLSDMESVDGELASRQLVVMNGHKLEANLEHFSATLADRGLLLDGPPLVDADDRLVQRYVGPAGEAKLVLVRRDGATSAVLTLLSQHL